jgi:trehalose-6-phosphate synthase
VIECDHLSQRGTIHMTPAARSSDVTHPSTDCAQCCLTSVIEQDRRSQRATAGHNRYSNYSLWKATKSIKRPILHDPPLKNFDSEWLKDYQSNVNAFAEHLSSICIYSKQTCVR